MQGLAELAQYLYNKGEENLIKEIDGKFYSLDNLKEVGGKKYADPIVTDNLNALFSYINGMAHEFDAASSKYIIQIKSPFEVDLYSSLDDHRQREHLFKCVSNIQRDSYLNGINTWVNDQEAFLLWLRCSFMQTEARDLLIKYCSTVEAASIRTYDGDGVTQIATIKNGIASKTDVELPSEIILHPYRTFNEIAPIAANFTFRMKKVGSDGVSFILKEADGGKWKRDMISEIEDHINVILPEEVKDLFVVI